MKDPIYSIRTPDESVNVSKERTLASFFRLLVGIIAAIVVLYTIVGAITTMAIKFIPDKIEKAFFPASGIARKLHTFETWPGREDVESLVRRLSTTKNGVAPESIQAFCSEDINAMAAPGGHLILTSGILTKMKTQIGMAFVLAHELAHIRRRHAMSSFGQKISAPILVALFSLNEDYFLNELLQNTGGLVQLSFSRSQESEADEIALNSLAEIYGTLAGADELFSLLKKNSDPNRSTSAFLSTHPGIEERAVQIRTDPRYRIPAPPTPWAPPNLNCNKPQKYL